MKREVLKNKRNETKKTLTSTFIFKKTTWKRIDNVVIQRIDEYEFKILGKKEGKEWMKSRN